MTDTVQDALDKMVAQLVSMQLHNPYVIGIHTGGAWIAEKIHQALNCDTPLGTIDISFYRDDFDLIGLHPKIKSSNLFCSVDDRTIVLVDDVLYTGRTIRAAMNEIFSYGRPNKIILAVLVDRDNRELPIRADVVGKVLKTPKQQQVKLQKIANGELQINITEHKR